MVNLQVKVFGTDIIHHRTSLSQITHLYGDVVHLAVNLALSAEVPDIQLAATANKGGLYLVGTGGCLDSSLLQSFLDFFPQRTIPLLKNCFFSFK